MRLMIRVTTKSRMPTAKIDSYWTLPRVASPCEIWTM